MVQYLGVFVRDYRLPYGRGSVGFGFWGGWIVLGLPPAEDRG